MAKHNGIRRVVHRMRYGSRIVAAMQYASRVAPGFTWHPGRWGCQIIPRHAPC